MLNSKGKTFLGVGLNLCAAMLWGFSFLTTKDSIDKLPICFVVGIRFLLATLLLVIIFPKKLKMKKETIIKGVIIGVIVGCGYIIQAFGLRMTNSSKTSFLTATYTVLTPFLAWIYFKNKPSIFKFIAAALSLAGICIVCFWTDASFNWGDLLTVFSALFFGMQIVCFKAFEKEDGLQLIILEMAVAGLMGFAGLAVEMPLSNSTITLSTDLIFPIVYTIIGGTLLPQVCQAYGQKLIAPEPASLLLALESVFATLLACIFAGEIMTINLYIGFSLIFISLVISITELKFITKLFKKKKDTKV